MREEHLPRAQRCSVRTIEVTQTIPRESGNRGKVIPQRFTVTLFESLTGLLA